MRLIDYFWEKIVIGRASALMRKHRQGGRRTAVIAGDYLSLKVMLQGRFEDKLISVLEGRVLRDMAPGSVCLDIGANIGNHSIAFAKWFSRVYAFEPNPETFDVLALNAKWSSGRIFPFNVGASDREFDAPAVVPADNLGGARITAAAPVPQAGIEPLRFNCVRLDEYLPEDVTRNVSFIKVDVEGHEYQALSGCRRIIEAARPLVAFELLRKDHEANGNRIRSLLDGYGYKYYYDVGRGLRLITRFRRKNYKMILASCRKLEA